MIDKFVKLTKNNNLISLILKCIIAASSCISVVNAPEIKVFCLVRDSVVSNV